MGKKQVDKSIKIFIERVKENFKPQKVIIFGSFAREENNKYSDVDFIVISKKFAEIPEEKRLDYLYELTKDLYPDFHVFGYTPYEFETVSKLSILEEIKKTGKVIYST